jgi:glycosyltransferase involved in cell wall biosynthesis
MNTKIKLSLLILTYNEERYIGDLLKDIDYADEIIVVDSFSTDKTVEIIKSFPNVKLIQHKFINYADQRNFLISQSSNDWVLLLDADERLTKELKTELIDFLNSKPKAEVYSFPRVFMFKQFPMRFTGTQKDWVTRLFDKRKCKYISAKFVHEKLEFLGTEEKFKNKMIHYTYYDFEIFKKKVAGYGKLKAQEEFLKGKKYNFIMHFLHPSFTFFSFFILKLGFLDGYRGLVLSYLNAYSVYVRYQELKAIQIKN